MSDPSIPLKIAGYLTDIPQIVYINHQLTQEILIDVNLALFNLFNYPLS